MKMPAPLRLISIFAVALLLGVTSSSCPCEEKCMNCFAFGAPNGDSSESMRCSCNEDELSGMEDQWIEDATADGFISAYCLE